MGVMTLIYKKNMYKILCNELLYSANNSNQYEYLFKGAMHDLSFYRPETIQSLIAQKMIEPCNECEEHKPAKEKPSKPVKKEEKVDAEEETNA